MLRLRPRNLPGHPPFGLVPIAWITGIFLTEHLVTDAILLVHQKTGNGGIVMPCAKQRLNDRKERTAAVEGPIGVAVAGGIIRIISYLNEELHPMGHREHLHIN